MGDRITSEKPLIREKRTQSAKRAPALRSKRALRCFVGLYHAPRDGLTRSRQQCTRRSRTLKISESKRIKVTWGIAKERVGREAKVAMSTHQGYSKDFLPGPTRSHIQEPFGALLSRNSPENDAEAFDGFRVTSPIGYRPRSRHRMK